MGGKQILISLKDKINNILCLRNIGRRIPQIMHRLDTIVPMSLTLRIFYFIRMGKRLDLKKPKDFNEKLQWLKVYYRDPLYVKCADKYLVRDYVANNGLGHILNDLYKVYERADDINFKELPERFALKCNHASGTNIICHDKNKLDEVSAKKRIRKWMRRKNGYIAGEYHYNYIKPLIIIERNLSANDGELPADYKIFCFNGKPHYIAVFVDRDKVTLAVKRAIFDFNWKFQDFVQSEHAADLKSIRKPVNLSQMYNVAKRLCAPFPFVRVDLYEDDGKVLFGELTFFPTGGFGKAYNEEFLEKTGSLLILPEKSNTKKWV